MPEKISYSKALELMKAGAKVAREGWNGKGMFVFLISSWTFTDGKQDN